MPTKDTALKEQMEANYRLYEFSVIDYIEDLVHIVDKENVANPEPLFKLWPEQKRAVKMLRTERRIINLKSRQIGFTWLTEADTSHELIFVPGYDAFALSQTEDPDAWQLVERMRFILERMPEWLIVPGKTKEKYMTWESTASKVTIHHPDTRSERGGWIKHKDSVFQSFAATERSARGWTGDRLIMDEMAKYAEAELVWKAAQPSVNRPNSGQVIIISTNEVGSYFETVYRSSMVGANNFKRIFLGWRADPRRDEAWYERTKRDLPNPDDMHSEYPETEEEAFTRTSGCFFPELKRELHIKPVRLHVPEYYLRYASIDYGLDGYAVLWFYVDQYGHSRCYRELYTKDKAIPDAAAMFRAANGNDRIEQIFAPDDLWSRRQETLKSFAETFAENGIWLSRTNNRRKQGWEALKGLLRPIPTRDEITGEPVMTAALTIDEGACFHLWRCLTGLQRNQKDYNEISDRNKTEHELTHLPDALRYYATARIYPSEQPAVQDADEDGYDDGGLSNFLKYGT